MAPGGSPCGLISRSDGRDLSLNEPCPPSDDRQTKLNRSRLDAWGWRIPFLLGLVVGIAGYILRRYVLEAGVAERRTRAPIIETLHDHWRLVAKFAGLSVYTSVTFRSSSQGREPHRLEEYGSRRHRQVCMV
jgi:hypothetical protein